MSYESAIEATGAVVHVSKSFGDYQGTSWAKVTHNGVTGWVSWDFGSCSGCDAYEAWEQGLLKRIRVDRYPDELPKEALAEFGKDYVDNIISQEQAEASAARYESWDAEAADVLEFLRANAV